MLLKKQNILLSSYVVFEVFLGFTMLLVFFLFVFTFYRIPGFLQMRFCVEDIF